MADKQKNGTVSLKAGKTTIVWEDREQAFGIYFVVGQIKKVLQKTRPGLYSDRIRSYCRELEGGGFLAIPGVREKLKTLKAGTDINRNFLDMIIGWLGQIEMFKRIKTGAQPESPNKKYAENYDRIFNKAA